MLITRRTKKLALFYTLCTVFSAKLSALPQKRGAARVGQKTQQKQSPVTNAAVAPTLGPVHDVEFTVKIPRSANTLQVKVKSDDTVSTLIDAIEVALSNVPGVSMEEVFMVSQDSEVFCLNDFDLVPQDGGVLKLSIISPQDNHSEELRVNKYIRRILLYTLQAIKKQSEDQVSAETKQALELFINNIRRQLVKALQSKSKQTRTNTGINFSTRPVAIELFANQQNLLGLTCSTEQMINQRRVEITIQSDELGSNIEGTLTSSRGENDPGNEITLKVPLYSENIYKYMGKAYGESKLPEAIFKKYRARYPRQ
jgi:hypothetical protein